MSQTNGLKNDLKAGRGPYSNSLEIVDFYVSPETVKNLDLTSIDEEIIEVNWDNYDNVCDKAESLVLTRRISDTLLGPQHYSIHELNSLSIEILDEVSITETAYIKRVEVNSGATYAYSTMVKYGSNLVSSEEKSITYSLSAPVIHKVDIASENQVDVAWLGPTEADIIQHPGPFKYVVLRAQEDETNYKAISGYLSDTTMTDINLSTSINQYKYKVICYDNNDVVIDTSISVSSIKLIAESTDFGIQLDWSSNASYNINNTKQYIYRKQADLSNDSFDLIDSLVLKGPKRLSYLDKSGLVRETSYCYMISASSTYGNSIIPESTIRSQSSCVLYTPLMTKPVVEKLEIQVYPNPIFNSLTIKSRESVDINIFNLSGSRVLNKENLSSGLNEIKLEIPSGVYLLQVQNRNGQTFSERIIKK